MRRDPVGEVAGARDLSGRTPSMRGHQTPDPATPPMRLERFQLGCSVASGYCYRGFRASCFTC